MFGKQSTKMCSVKLAQAQASFDAACAARDAGQTEKALSLALIAAERAETARAWRLVRQSLEVAGDVLEAMAEPAQAIEMYEKALGMAREPRADLQTLLKLTPLFYLQRRGPEARRTARQASALAGRLREPAALSLATHWLACLDYEQENWSSAEAHFHAALTASHRAADVTPTRSASLLLDLGNVIAHQGRWSEARAWLEQSVAAAERAGDGQLRVDTRRSLAVVCALSHDLDRAGELLFECLDLQQQRGDTDGYVEMLSELARLAGRRGLPVAVMGEAQPAPTPRRGFSVASA